MQECVPVCVFTLLFLDQYLDSLCCVFVINAEKRPPSEHMASPPFLSTSIFLRRQPGRAGISRSGQCDTMFGANVGLFSLRRAGAGLGLIQSPTTQSRLRWCVGHALTSSTLHPKGTHSDDFSYDALSVSQLKHFLDSAGIDYRDCYEKKELAERLHGARHSLTPSLRSELESCASGSAPRPDLTQKNRGDPLLQEERRTIEVFDRSAPSVVHITTSSIVQRQFSLDLSEIPLGTGSGFVWDRDGHVVTNFHVVQNAQRAKISMADNTSFEGKLVGAEPDKDLAVLRIDGLSPSRPIVPLAVGSSHGLRVGQKVFAIGNPFGLDQTLTTGVVSGVGRDVKGITGRTIRGVVQVRGRIERWTYG